MHLSGAYVTPHFSEFENCAMGLGGLRGCFKRGIVFRGFD